jgi:hypothetical protein
VKRVIALLLALLASAGSGGVFAWLARRQVRYVAANQLAPLHDSEEQDALRAGLRILDHGTTTELPFVREVPLGAGQCVALVATIDGVTLFERAEIALATGRTAESRSTYTRLVHLALCAETSTTATLTLTATPDRDELAPSQLRYTVLRGEVSSPRTYTQLDVDPLERARFDEAAVRAREAAIEGERLEPLVTIPPEHAVLAPATRATFAAIRALSGRAGVAPALAPEVARADPFRRPDDLAVPPRAFGSDGVVRVLAVLDAGAFSAAHGGRCLSVALARLDDPAFAVPVTRIAVPSLEETAVPQADPALALDTVCPADGLFAYVTVEAAGGEYLLAIRAGAETSPSPAPSRFGEAPARGEALVPALPVALLARARAACEAGTAAECVRWADLADGHVLGAGDAREPLSRACELLDGPACDRLAAQLEAAGDAAGSDGAERRACAAGASAACLRRAARFRDAARFAEAYATYRFACARGSSESCAAVQTMDEWQLAPPEAREPASPP